MLDIRQQQFLMLLLMMQPEFDQVGDFRRDGRGEQARSMAASTWAR